MDGDCDIDLMDYRRFYSCMSLSGPGTPTPGFCAELYDSDGDQDVDLADFAAFQAVFGGSGL